MEHDATNAFTTLNSIKINYISWIIIIICVFMVSYPNFGWGAITFIIMILMYYVGHVLSHSNKNLFTAVHNYHHDHDNFFSHFSQIILECGVPVVLIPYYYLYGNTFLNVWTVVLFVFYYTTIHNYNYGYKKVNDVHYKHHLNVFTNLGPDICDVTFGTKNNQDVQVENTNHYIPNIIIGTTLVLIIKYGCALDQNFKYLCINGGIYTQIMLFIFLSITSIWLYFFHDDDCPSAKNIFTESETKQNKTKQNKTKQNKTKQNKTKQNKTKQNKTKQNKTK
jgi:hypothetical protein